MAHIVVVVVAIVGIIAAVVVNGITAAPLQRASGPFGDLANDALSATIVDYSVEGNVVHVLVGG